MAEANALVACENVGGKIAWLPRKNMVKDRMKEGSPMPNLVDDLFDHPVVIISRDCGNVVEVLLVSAFWF